MPTKPFANLLKMIGRRFDSVGLQFAHIIGVNSYEDPALAWLRPHLDVNADLNFTVLPESERGSAVLGATAHFSRQVGAFDRFFYENSDGSSKFLDRIQELAQRRMSLGGNRRSGPLVAIALTLADHRRPGP